MTAANDNDPLVIRRHNATSWNQILAYIALWLAVFASGMLFVLYR